MTMAKQLSIGVPNPRALAEIVLGRRVDWKRVANPERLVERALGMKYKDLFDSKNRASPLYSALYTKAPPRAAAAAAHKPASGDTYMQAKARTKGDTEAILASRRALLPTFLHAPSAGDSGTPWNPAGT